MNKKRVFCNNCSCKKPYNEIHKNSSKVKPVHDLCCHDSLDIPTYINIMQKQCPKIKGE